MTNALIARDKKSHLQYQYYDYNTIQNASYLSAQKHSKRYFITIFHPPHYKAFSIKLKIIFIFL